MSGLVPVIFRDDFLILTRPRTRHSGRYVDGWGARVYAREDDAREQLARMSGDPILLSARTAAEASDLPALRAGVKSAARTIKDLHEWLTQAEESLANGSAPERAMLAEAIGRFIESDEHQRDVETVSAAEKLRSAPDAAPGAR